MTWLIWRRQRTALLTALALVALAAVALVSARVGWTAQVRAYGVEDCLGTVGSCAAPAWSRFRENGFPGSGLLVGYLLVLPALAGAIVGTGLFGRELEQGTFEFALTQSVGRLRSWTAGTLCSAVPVAIGIGLVGLLARWAFGPFWTVLTTAPLETPYFEATGFVPIGFTLSAFGFTSLAGLLLRSTAGAATIGLAAQLAVQVWLGLTRKLTGWLPPDMVTGPLAGGAPTIPLGAHGAGLVYLSAADERVNGMGERCLSAPDLNACLSDNGVVRVGFLYYPADAVWPLQGIETGILTLLAVVVLAAGFVVLRARIR